MNASDSETQAPKVGIVYPIAQREEANERLMKKAP